MDPQKASARHNIVFSILAGFVLLSVGVSLLHLPESINNLIVLGIAFLMACLVAAQYMGLKWEGRLIDVIVVIPLALFALLIIVLIPDIGHHSIPFLQGH